MFFVKFEKYVAKKIEIWNIFNASDFESSSGPKQLFEEF